MKKGPFRYFRNRVLIAKAVRENLNLGAELFLQNVI
jgi:hypothetical protein